MGWTSGTRLGAYEITGLLGAGGMGEVYRARDAKLNRDVALKVLPDSFSLDPDRLARFEREAQVLASLNHPNIAAIYGFEESNGTQALVLELVDGLTLADRIAQGPIPLTEALPMARQITEAIETAHEQGIVHRDLKPANIKLRPDGRVKVLDFGLAKAMEPSIAVAGDVTASPTITSPAMTQLGMLLGTAAYMSPEQAKGRPADKRSDIWAFGCVLFEMLTGGRAFSGEDVSDTLAAVLRAEPEWTALPAEVPEPLRLLLPRCLEKDRRNRIADASTIRFALDVSPVVGRSATATGEAASLWRRAAPAAIAAIVAAAVTGVAAWILRGAPAEPPSVTRFPVAIDETLLFASNGLPLINISADGSQVAYAARDTESVPGWQRLYLRSMAETVVKPIPGTQVQGGTVGAPVFSPDNQAIVYYSGASSSGVYDQMKGVLKRIDLRGSAPITLCEVVLPIGLTWNGDTDTIVFAQPSKGILRVPAKGGAPEQIVSIQDGEVAQGPQMLPGGEAVLFTLARGVPPGSPGPSDDTWDTADIIVQTLASGTRKTLIQGGSDARYLPSGHLVYAVGGRLHAVAFDAQRLELVGKAAPVLEGVMRSRFGPLTRTGTAHFSASDSGSLVYLPGPASTTASPQNVAYIDRRGAIESLNLTAAAYEFPRIAPNGKQLAVGINNGTDVNIWIYDLSGTNTIRQLTSGGRNRFPVWSADSQYVTFQSDRDGDLAIFRQRADLSAAAARLPTPEAGTAHMPDAWSPTDDQLLIDVVSASGFSLVILNARDGKMVPFEGVQSRSVAPAAVFSPDGRWVAYQSNEVPNPRIFVRRATGPGPALPVVNGRAPRFSPDGKQIYYSVADRLMAVELRMEPTFSAGNPVMVNQNRATGAVLRSAQSSYSPAASFVAIPRNWDLIDDNRFIGIIDETPTMTSAARHIEVVLGWFNELNQRVPLK